MSLNASNTANTALLVSTTTGALATINEHAVVIGLSLSAISVIVGVFFHIYNIKLRKEQATRDIERIRADILKEIREEKDNN